MNHLRSVIAASNNFIRVNSPAILTGIGVAGTVTTAYLAGNAGYQSAKRLSEQPPKNSPWEKFEETWDLYIPAAISGVVTVGTIVMASRVSSKRAAAAYSLLAVSERAFEEYREKVVEVIGQKKEQTVRDEIAQDRVTNNPPSLVVADGTDVLCCEMYTGRYFKSNMEALRRAENTINKKIIHEAYVTLDELYYILDLPSTSGSSDVGWPGGKPFCFEFSSVLTPEGKPCLAFNYSYITVI